MMIGWSGRRKFLTMMGFLLPAIIGILVFSVYPIIVNTYISFTNKNSSHPNPDCTAGLNNVMIPTCWPVFRDKAPTGIAEPFRLATPLYKNYSDMFGLLFTQDALLGLLAIVVAIGVPWYAAGRINKHQEQQLTRSIPSALLWVIAIVGMVVLGVLFQLPTAVKNLANTGDFLLVVGRTLLFVIIRVPFTFVIGLVFALILNSNFIKFRTFFRVVLFIPWAASSMAVLMALVWQFFFREQGTINAVLALFNVPAKTWLNDPISAFAAVLIVDIWFSYPFFMIVILGALQSIPAEAFEASEIDGANYWQQLVNITLPLIRPAILPATVLTSISAFQMFGTAWAITAGGPGIVGKPGATEFVMIYAYKMIFQTQNYGRATAFAVVIFLILFTATMYSNRFTKITKGAYE
jgi:arabinogalactan oligomer / maltooligosaccharide transport system permease protein